MTPLIFGLYSTNIICLIICFCFFVHAIDVNSKQLKKSKMFNYITLKKLLLECASNIKGDVCLNCVITYYVWIYYLRQVVSRRAIMCALERLRWLMVSSIRRQLFYEVIFIPKMLFKFVSTIVVEENSLYGHDPTIFQFSFFLFIFLGHSFVIWSGLEFKTTPSSNRDLLRERMRMCLLFFL